MRILEEKRIVFSQDMMRERTFRGKADRPRSPGVHIQAVNRALGIAAGKLSDSDDDSFPFERMTDEVYPLMMALGVFWEEGYVSTFREDQLIWQPGELERDGIFGTPDGLLIDQEELVGWECKQTTKKIQSISSCWMYLKQGVSYYAMGGPARTRYDICWLLGNYTRPYQPILTQSLVEFSMLEAESWWKIVLKASKNVKPE